MSNANFYAGFPQNPDELYDFPPQVIWKDEDPDIESSEKVSVKLKTSFTEEKTWEIKVATPQENLLSFTLSHQYNEEKSQWNWHLSDLTGSHAKSLESQNIDAVFNYCNDSTVLLIGYATDEVKSRLKRKP